MDPSHAVSHIVLAEDNPADVGLVREALRKHNVYCELRVISDGEAAVDFIDSLDIDVSLACPDLLLLDLYLPKRDGREILTRLRESGRCSRIPVVVLTSADWVRNEPVFESDGSLQYFVKPMSLNQYLDLGRIVKEVIGRGQSC
jgi:chemotaxis family two-component system response regulator Rcp1